MSMSEMLKAFKVYELKLKSGEEPMIMKQHSKLSTIMNQRSKPLMIMDQRSRLSMSMN